MDEKHKQNIWCQQETHFKQNDVGRITLQV